jgi:hypothetical protein
MILAVSLSFPYLSVTDRLEAYVCSAQTCTCKLSPFVTLAGYDTFWPLTNNLANVVPTSSVPVGVMVWSVSHAGVDKFAPRPLTTTALFAEGNVKHCPMSTGSR